MAWVTPSTRSTGTLITAAIWNADVVANPQYLKGQAGAIDFEDGAAFTKSQNGETRVSSINANAGTGTFASVVAGQGTSFQDQMRLICFGTAFTTAGGYVQDGALLDAGANLAGGLSIMARHATTGIIRFYIAGSADANEAMRINASSNVGIGTASIDSRLHVATNGAACEVVIEDEAGGADSQITFKDGGTARHSLGWDDSATSFVIVSGGVLGTNNKLSLSSTSSRLLFDSTHYVEVASTGAITLEAVDQQISLATSGSIVLGPAGALVFIADSANANMTVGLTMNQGGADNQILCFKSSDVATGITSIAAAATETDDYATFQKFAAATGGLSLIALGENAAVTTNLALWSHGGQASTTRSTAGRALIEFYAAQHNGSNTPADITADGNVFGIRCRRGGADVTIVLFDEDGDAHNDGTGWTAYDDHDDVMLCNAIDVALGGVDPIKAGFTAFLEENRQTLQRLKLVNFDEYDRPFVNSTKMISLLVGTARQLGRQNAALERRVADLESRMLAA